MRAIFNIYIYLKFGVEVVKNPFCNLHASQYSFFFDKQFAFTRGICWDAAKCCMVAVSDILTESQFNKLLVKFFY